MSPTRPVFVVAGIGNATGTGAATARIFSKAGYSIALIGRNAEYLELLQGEIIASGGHAASFHTASYSFSDVANVFTRIQDHFPQPTYILRAALFNVALNHWKPFLELSLTEIEQSLEFNLVSAFAFARQVIPIFKSNDIDQEGRRGSLLFTGSTGSLRGNVTTSAYSAAKSGTRALSQSLAKEFGKDNIHVVHTIIDGSILTDRQRNLRKDLEWEKNEDIRLTPEGIASAYLYLVNQHRSTWTWELDLRPAHEKW